MCVSCLCVEPNLPTSSASARRGIISQPNTHNIFTAVAAAAAYSNA